MRLSPPSPAGVLSVIALFAALGGTGYAASKAVSPTAHAAARGVTKKYVKKTARRIADAEIKSKGPAVADTEIASKAGTLSVANATNAQNAQNANQANNASNLGGKPASAYLGSGAVQPSGLKRLSAGSNAQIAALGPFTVTLSCTRSGSTTTVNLTASSSEAGSSLGTTPGGTANVNVPANTPKVIDTANDSGTTNQAESNGVTNTLLAPSGAQLDLVDTIGVHGFSNDCYGESLILL